MATILSINRTYEKHRKENPESTLSARAIRQATQAGDLPTIMAGSKALINYDTFNKWLQSELDQRN